MTDHPHHPTTEAIQAWRALGRTPDVTWVDWAVGLLVAGEDTPSLRVLAGMGPRFNFFEMVGLVDRTLAELNTPTPSKKEAIAAYAEELIGLLAQGDAVVGPTLRDLADLCIETDYRAMLFDFYLLHHAFQDLQIRPDQHYWPGAGRENIDAIVQAEARRWLEPQQEGDRGRAP